MGASWNARTGAVVSRSVPSPTLVCTVATAPPHNPDKHKARWTKGVHIVLRGETRFLGTGVLRYSIYTNAELADRNYTDSGFGDEGKLQR